MSEQGVDAIGVTAFCVRHATHTHELTHTHLQLGR